MTNQQAQEYQSLVRGAATFILLHQSNPPVDAQSIAALYPVGLEKINADIDKIVQYEHAKIGGVFELAAASQQNG